MEKNADLELITKAQAGDHLSFAALADRHYMTVYRFAFKWCRSREDAEDITQEVFIKLAGKMHLFNRRSKFTTWLYSITANCARDYARKNSRWVNGKQPGPLENGMIASPNPGPENNVIAKSILKVIGELPDKLKEAMLLVYAEDMNHKEAAQIIGCAETTVSWRIFQAKRKLRKVLS
jgi:RNA polymerase sigma-70 factor (ECF subfamily)